MKFISKHPNGRKRAVIHVKGDLEFPFILVDVPGKRLVVTGRFMWWSRSERFLRGLDSSLFILDGVGKAYTVVRVGNDGKDIPVISTERVDQPLDLDTLLSIYRSDCARTHREPSDTSSIVTYRDFATMVLTDRKLTV